MTSELSELYQKLANTECALATAKMETDGLMMEVDHLRTLNATQASIIADLKAERDELHSAIEEAIVRLKKQKGE